MEMNMLKEMNQKLEKAMPLITPVSVLIGVLLSIWLKPFADVVPWIFGFMTFAGSLGSSLRELKKVLLHPLPLCVLLLILHVLMPFVAWAIGHLAFSGDPMTITGLVLGMVIPVGITSFIWVAIYQGNVALALSVILIDTFLSPFIVPYSLAFFVGAKVHMDILAMMNGLFWMVVFPSIAGMVLNHLTKGKVKETWGPRFAPFTKMGLGLVVAINSAVVAPYLVHVNLKLVEIGFIVLIIAALGYWVSWMIALLFHWERDLIVSMVFSGGMRNISAGAVLAVAYFPPAVAVPVVVAMLFQQLLASLYGHFLYRIYDNPKHLKENQLIL
jgi:bile acid:Na+ symporter, BASS family